MDHRVVVALGVPEGREVLHILFQHRFQLFLRNQLKHVPIHRIKALVVVAVAGVAGHGEEVKQVQAVILVPPIQPPFEQSVSVAVIPRSLLRVTQHVVRCLD